MIDELLNGLTINHIGIVVNPDMKKMIENNTGEVFVKDEIQGVSVCFVWDKYMMLYKEYITKEGRAINYQLGFSHICYDVDSQKEMDKLHNIIISKKIGFRVTLPEPSPTKQCNFVSFYKMIGVGLVEFNILNRSV